MERLSSNDCMAQRNNGERPQKDAPGRLDRQSNAVRPQEEPAIDGDVERERQETHEQRIDRKMRELEARGILRRGNGRKPQGLARPIKLRGEGPTISQMIIEDRR